MNFSPETPPYSFLSIVAQHCPLSMRLYLMLWDKKKLDYKIVVKKNDITTDFLMTKQKFSSLIMPLCAENLLSYKVDKLKYLIELVAWDDMIDA